MNINIKTIPHSNQRYNTPGDWWFTDNGDLEIRVSNMNNWKYEALVAFHELAEVLLCKERGISTKEADEFDIRWNEVHKNEGTDNEPGDDPCCPYRMEHFFATSVERLLAAELRVDWDSYGEAVPL